MSQGRPDLSPVARWDEPSGRFVPAPAWISPASADPATAFAEDASGRLWVALGSGHLARLEGGRWSALELEPPLPKTYVNALAPDDRGRLWVASQGVHVIDDTAGTTLRVRPGPSELQETDVTCIERDREGRMYFCTERGVARFDETRGTVRFFTRGDGLPGNGTALGLRDREGALWFSDMSGLARLEPQPDTRVPPPQARIAAVRVDGEALPISPLGASIVGPLKLHPGPRRVTIEFFAISHAPGARVLFQQRVGGSEVGWSEPSDARSVEFPRLDPGRQVVAIRAVTAGGAAASPAVVDFTIPEPVWRRPWFLAVATALAAAAVYSLYRVRISRALALERMRTRIATDLHDEVGADLSRISLLAEFSRRDLDKKDEECGRARAMLAEVARTAREAVEEMSDIVWALKPGRDNLGQVVSRVRDLAAELAGPAGVQLRVSADENLEFVRFAGERRRDLYLVLKEAVTNAFLHANARTLEISVRATGRRLVAEVRDDGRGFVPGEGRASADGGQGLGHMRVRAARLGGQLTIDTAPGSGTTVRIEILGIPRGA